METLKIVGIVFVLLLVGGCIYGFFETCQEKFNYHFFTKGSFISMTVAVGCGYLGKYVHETTLSNSSGHSIGWGLLGVAGVIVVVMVCRNFKQTNFWYGLFGSILQLSILGVAGFITISLLMIYAAIQLAGSAHTSDKSDEQDANDAWADSELNPSSPNFDEKKCYYTY